MRYPMMAWRMRSILLQLTGVRYENGEVSLQNRPMRLPVAPKVEGSLKNSTIPIRTAEAPEECVAVAAVA